MLCRALLTIIAISYLLCVLLLSGLQKEDLDVNTLKKLQRHNVNIDDLNNEDLRQECISNSTFGKVDSEIETTTEEINEGQQKQNNNYRQLTKTQLQTIVQYIIDTKSDVPTVMDLIEETTTRSTDIEHYITLQVDDIKPNLQEAKHETLGTKKNYTKEDSMSRIEKPDLQKFIKLWNMYNNAYVKDSKNRETVKPMFIQPEKFTTLPIALKPNDNEKEIEMQYYNMTEIIMDYISKNKVNPTTATPPLTKNDIVETVSHDLKKYVAQNYNDKKVKNINEKVKTKHEPLEMLTLLINDMQRQSNVKIMQKKNAEIVDPLKDILKSKAKKYLNDILWNDEQLNDPVTHYAQIITERPSVLENGLQLGILKSFELHKNKINENVGQIMDKNNNIKYVKIPVDIIKEIAESIKAIVLKDLKNDLLTVTPKIITKTTLEQEPTTSKQENIQDSNTIMEKFIDLFQQFKTMKEKTVISGDTKSKTTEKKSIEHEYKGPLKLAYPPPMPPLNPYGVIMPMAQITPIFANRYGQNSNLSPPFVHDSNRNNNLNSVHEITQVNIFHHKNEPRLVPLTIQTNSYEIPPLGIPVSKPINIVNQNIVVTTRNPYMRPKIDRHHGNILHHELDNKNNNNGNRNDWLNTNDMTNLHRTHYDFNLDKSKNSNKDTKFMRMSRERQTYTSDYNGNNQYRPGNFKSHFNRSDYDRMRLRNQNIKKFHERLERTDDSNTMDDREDCCQVKMASRQQLPLNNIKNRSHYDDTHFRNFLKTQQKVNDMLERILATKTKSDGPRSVEIP